MKPAGIAAIVFVGLLAFGLGAWWAVTSSQPDLEMAGSGYVLPEPRDLPAFELVDGQGVAFSQTDFQGHWSVLYFGFTYCPDVCPAALAVMAQVKQQLDGDEDLDDRYYLVSVDPARDTPVRLTEYVTYFDPEFLGLTGEFDQLDRLTRAAGAVYKVPDAPEDDNYLVAHSSTLTLIDPAGRVHAIFTSPFDPNVIADKLGALMRNWKAD